jgi:hypothetical protein
LRHVPRSRIQPQALPQVRHRTACIAEARGPTPMRPPPVKR